MKPISYRNEYGVEREGPNRTHRLRMWHGLRATYWLAICRCCPWKRKVADRAEGEALFAVHLEHPPPPKWYRKHPAAVALGKLGGRPRIHTPDNVLPVPRVYRSALCRTRNVAKHLKCPVCACICHHDPEGWGRYWHKWPHLKVRQRRASAAPAWPPKLTDMLLLDPCTVDISPFSDGPTSPHKPRRSKRRGRRTWRSRSKRRS